MKSHYHVLDGLRGTAAFSILLFHIWEKLAPGPSNNLMPHAFLAVDFFFALSGFVLSHAYDVRLAGSAPPRAALTPGGFIQRRLIRLHPMALAGLAIGVAAYLLDPFVGDTQRIGEGIPAGALALTIALSALLVPTPPLPNHGTETHSLNGPSWTLLQEYVASILYGLWLHKIGNRLCIALAVLSAAALAATAWHFGGLGHGWGWGDAWSGPVRLAYPFLAGLLVHRLRPRIVLPQPFLLLSLALVAIFAAPMMGRLNWLFETTCVIVVFPLLLAAGAGVTTVHGKIGTLCRFMGEMSYPLYLVHYPFIHLLDHWAQNVRPDATRLHMAAAGLYLGVTLLAYVLLRWYDRPVRAWLARKYMQPTQAQVVAKAA